MMINVNEQLHHRYTHTQKAYLSPFIDVAFVISTCTNGTVALSSVNVEIAVDDQKHTQILDIQARVLFSWFGETSSVPTLLKIFDNLVGLIYIKNRTEANHLTYRNTINKISKLQFPKAFLYNFFI